MKALIPLLVVLCSTISTLNADGERAEKKEPKRIQIGELATLVDGEEAIIRFRVDNTYWISGAVPKGRARSFGIKPVLPGKSGTRISVLVVGKLADAMERFGYSPPNPSDRLAGAQIEARGKVIVHPAPKNAPEKGPSYQFRIGDLKAFRVVSPSQEKR